MKHHCSLLKVTSTTTLNHFKLNYYSVQFCSRGFQTSTKDTPACKTLNIKRLKNPRENFTKELCFNLKKIPIDFGRVTEIRADTSAKTNDSG